MGPTPWFLLSVAPINVDGVMVGQAFKCLTDRSRVTKACGINISGQALTLDLSHRLFE
jgi:hypothetical protein